MKTEAVKQVRRWLRGLAVLVGVVAVAGLLVNTVVNTVVNTLAGLGQQTAQVGHEAHRAQGQFTPAAATNHSDFPWTLAPAYAASDEERIEMEVSPTPYTPDGSKSSDVYHCFLLNPNFSRDVMVTGANIIPGNRRIVHHAILYKIDPNQAAAVTAKDRETNGKGWNCFGGPGLTTNDPQTATAGGNWLSIWVPGVGDGHFPDGIGNPMAKGSLIVMEVHYNLNNETGSDQSKVVLNIAPVGRKLNPIQSQLQVAPVELACPDGFSDPACQRENTIRENVARAGILSGFYLPNSLLTICGQTPAQHQKPVGDASKIVMSCDQKINTPTTLYSIGGHMHLLAKSIKIELNPGQAYSKTLLHIPKWDYHWQGNYWFKTPVQLNPDDVIRTTCTFDNSVENQPLIGGKASRPKYVMWAEATTDEMCLGILMASAGPKP
jgi:hypothetical protein